MNKRNLWRKWYIFLMGSCLVMGLLAGCQKEKQTSLKTRQTLTLWHYMDSPARKQALSDIADAFKDESGYLNTDVSTGGYNLNHNYYPFFLNNISGASN